MIPPLPPGQSEDQQNMVGWKNTFNMRQVTLMNLAASQMGSKNGNRPNYIGMGCITSPSKSLDLLRKNLQSAINKDIDLVIKKYLDKFFQPAVSNIRANLGKNSVTDDLIKTVCRQMLEEAKVMYKVNSSRDSSPYDCSDTEIGTATDNKSDRLSPVHCKRKESDTESESGFHLTNKRHKFRPAKTMESFSCKLPEKREGPKWNPDRIMQHTLFIMGAKANKLLGYGQTRGRLYVRHPEIFRYSGDPEDKEWLASRNLLPASGGRAYLMLLEDIQELTASDDYKNSPNLQLDELKGFELPLFMLNKIRGFMDNVRTDKKSAPIDFFDFHQSATPLSAAIDSGPSTPSDTFQTLESQSICTTSSKHSDINLINLSEPSPGSNQSFFTHSPLTSQTLSPTTLLGINVDGTNNNNLNLFNNTQEKILSSLLSVVPSHISHDSSQELL